jgi:photosystem II stability/assembly factor-like uncharacterized protein
MRHQSACLTICLRVFALLAAVAPLSAAPHPSSDVPTLTGRTELRAFQAISALSGWVWIDRQLHWTDDGGEHWREIVVPASDDAQLQAVAFADSQHGLVVTTALDARGETSFVLARTDDGGRSWHSAPLPLFAAGDPAALAGAVFLELLDSDTGWLVVKQATSSAFSLGTLFRTTDGGTTWTRHAMPAGAPVHFSSRLDGWIEAGALDDAGYVTRDGGETWAPQTRPQPPTAAAARAAGLTEVSLATSDAGWATLTSGNCDASACTLRVELRRTEDGGRTWVPLPLPGWRAALEVTYAAPSTPASAQSAQGLTLSFQGAGFDSCMIGVLPSVADMQTWWTSSPYRVRNLYLGGASQANCGTLTKAYVQQLAQQGWLFIPTWVGPQPPCSTVGRKMSADPAVAYSQGVIEAYLALNTAESLGLTLAGQSGTALYYDVEAYPPNDQACRDAAKAFISGWTATLHATDNTAGVYGSPCRSFIGDYAGLSNVPDMVWLAYWSYPAYDPTASVWNLPCVDNTLWSGAQRLRQYAGGHVEDWGGVSILIDSNVVNGAVATVVGDCTPAAGQVALFVYPNYGGQCVVKSLGHYPTAASLGLPPGTISSLRVGPGVRLRLCQAEFYAGICEDFTADTNQLGGHPVGDNQAASAQVETAPLATPERVWLPAVSARANVSIPLPNGDFEAGPAAWTTNSALQRQLIVPASSLPAGIAPRSGNWAAWLGGAHGETAYLEQSVTITSEAPFFTYWQRIVSAETRCHYDVVSLWVNNTVAGAYGLCSSAQAAGWTRRSFDLSAHAGQTVSVRIRVTTDGSLISSLFLDDVAFQSAP